MACTFCGMEDIYALRRLALERVIAAKFEGKQAAFAKAAGINPTYVTRTHPCPLTGAARGPCPGWQVDHIEALVCGGRDELRNLQWLTVEEHKAKTRVEVKLCRRR